MQNDLNRHWQVRLHVGQPGFIAHMREGLAAVAMLCMAGPQAAFVLALLCLAARRRGAVRGTADQLLVGPNGFYRYWRNAVPASEKSANTMHAVDPVGAEYTNGAGDAKGVADTTAPADRGAARVLKSFWQGPFWLTLSLQDPYFPHTPADTVTVWSIGQPPEVWRRFRVLVLSARWADARDTGGRVAI